MYQNGFQMLKRNQSWSKMQGITLEHSATAALALVVFWLLLINVEHLNGGETLNSESATQRFVLINVDSGNIDHALQDSS